jgi:hypothetical protein
MNVSVAVDSDDRSEWEVLCFSIVVVSLEYAYTRGYVKTSYGVCKIKNKYYFVINTE